MLSLLRKIRTKEPVDAYCKNCPYHMHIDTFIKPEDNHLCLKNARVVTVEKTPIEPIEDAVEYEMCYSKNANNDCPDYLNVKEDVHFLPLKEAFRLSHLENTVIKLLRRKRKDQKEQEKDEGSGG